MRQLPSCLTQVFNSVCLNNVYRGCVNERIKKLVFFFSKSYLVVWSDEFIQKHNKIELTYCRYLLGYSRHSTVPMQLSSVSRYACYLFIYIWLLKKHWYNAIENMHVDYNSRFYDREINIRAYSNVDSLLVMIIFLYVLNIISIVEPTFPIRYINILQLSKKTK